MPCVPRFLSWDADALRHASSVDHLPYAASSRTLLCISAPGVVAQARTITEKRALPAGTGPKDLVVADWPGQWRWDALLIDDLMVARAGVGQLERSDAYRATDCSARGYRYTTRQSS